MRVTVDGLSRSLWCAEPAPCVSVGKEKCLLLCEVRENWQNSTRAAPFIPRLESCMKAASIGNVFTESELSINVKLRVIRAFNGVLPILLNEARSLIVKCSLCILGPPLAESSSLVVFCAIVIEGV